MAGLTRLYLYYTNRYRQEVQEKSTCRPKKVAHSAEMDDSRTEEAVAELLWGLGVSYRWNDSTLPGQPDFWMKSRRPRFLSTVVSGTPIGTVQGQNSPDEHGVLDQEDTDKQMP